MMHGQANIKNIDLAMWKDKIEWNTYTTAFQMYVTNTEPTNSNISKSAMFLF